MKKYSIIILCLFAALALGANAYSTKINEALKKCLNDSGKWKYIEFADGTSQTTANTSGGGGGGVPTNRTINTTAPLAGGGDLSANRTFSITQATGTQSGYLSSTDWTTFNTKQSALGFTPENAANKGASSGYASLNASSLVIQNPANATATPTASKIPIADANGKLDSWVTPGGGGGAVNSVFGRTGTVTASTNDYTWAQINKATSDIADITTRSHASLTDIGSNNHTQIDTFVSSKAAANGLASLDVNSRVVQDPASVKGNSIQCVKTWTTGATKTGDINEASLYSWAMPGNTVAPGNIIRITAYLRMTNNANNKTYRLKFGAAQVVFTQINFTTSDAVKYQTDIIIKTTTSQMTCQSLANSNGGWSTSSGYNTASDDTTGSITIDFVGQLAVGTDFITLEAVAIEVL